MRPYACIAALLFGVCLSSAAADLAIHLKDGSGKPLVDAVVFIPAASPAPGRPAAPKRATIVQRNRVFAPFVTAVEKGTAIDFPNEDTILHHVYSFSPPKRFEIKLYRGMSPAPVVFDTPGIVALGCNLHDWMLAFVVVLDTPYFSKSDAKGNARVGNVPAGTHDLMGWYPGMREPVKLRQVTLPADTSQPIEHRLEVPLKTRPHAPPHDPLRY